MADQTRTFTADQLEEIGVPFECVEPDEDNPDSLAVELHHEQTDSRRWSSTHRLIFRAPDDGKTYRVTYQRPLTEHQECDLWRDGNAIVATEVAQVPVTVMRWQPVKADEIHPQ
jgi:hypothetical protein